MPSRVQLTDVAEATGYSISTISRALRKDPRIPESTQVKVREAAAKLGYRPDPLVSAFASRQRGKVADITTIAYVTTFPTATGWQKNWFYRGCFQGASERADQLGYRVEHFWLKEPGMKGARFSKILYSRGIALMCVAPTPQVRGHLSLDWSRFSSATIGYTLLRPNLHRATPHHFHGVQMALRELKRAGYRRIGFSAFRSTSKRTDDLWVAGASVFQRNNPDVQLEFFLYDDESLGKISQWCRRHRIEVVAGCEKEIYLELKGSDLNVEYVALDWNEGYGEVAGIDQRPLLVGASAVDLIVAQQRSGEMGLPENPVTMMTEGVWRGASNLRKYRGRK